MEDGEFCDCGGVGEAVGEHHDDGEDQGGCADDGGADEDGFGSGFEGIACAVVFFQEQF